MSNRWYNSERRKEHLPTIKAFLDDMGLEWHWIAGNWHLRIENKFDVFPTSNRYHFLPSGERGGFKDYDDLGRIFIELMESLEKN